MINSRMMVMVVSLERHMQDARQVLFEAILGQGGIPVGLPYPSIPATYINKLNAQCLPDADYILLLIGEDYGALNEQGVSYVHSAYATALGMRKPIFSLVYKGSSGKAREGLDSKRLQGFIKLLEGHPMYFWHDDDSLRDSAERALESIFESNPSPGWSKNSSNFSDHNLISQLKDQITQLKQRLKAPPVTKPSISLESDRRSWKVHYYCNAFREGRLKQVNGRIPLQMKEAFDYLAPSLLSPVTESRLQSSFASKIHRQVLEKVQSEWDGCHAVSDVRIGQDSMDELKLRLRALRVIDFDDQGRWLLTSSGEELALKNQK